MIDTISCRVKTGEEKTLLDQLFLLYVNKRKRIYNYNFKSQVSNEKVTTEIKTSWVNLTD